MNKIADSAEFNDSLLDFEDEVDCAIVNDSKFESAMSDIANADSTAQEETTDDELGDDDIVDTSIDYDDSIPGADMVSIDADDIIAAERDIAHDPFEDEDLMDAAVGDDYGDLLDDEDYDDEDYEDDED